MLATPTGESLQEPDGVDVEMVEEVGVGRPPVGALVLHQVALQDLLAGVALLHHPQLGQKNRREETFVLTARPVRKTKRKRLHTAFRSRLFYLDYISKGGEASTSQDTKTNEDVLFLSVPTATTHDATNVCARPLAAIITDPSGSLC